MEKIAVVNDDRAFLTLMEELLREEGYDVVLLHEGSLAYDKIKSDQPSLAILDLRMEEPDAGWKTIELLRLDPQTLEIPLIICSAALQEMRDRRAWLEQHGVGAIVKPFDLEDLIAAIRNTLTTHQPPFIGLDVA